MLRRYLVTAQAAVGRYVGPVPPAAPLLHDLRSAFRAEMARDEAERAWDAFGGRIAVVLPGGGARGAYEAGVLLAFQDARLPTHIISATSIGGINAASYASQADGLVGNAEPLVEAWRDVTPPAVGIDWTRYAFMLGGLIAVTAGLGNLIYYQLTVGGLRVHLRHPALLWASLALAGSAVLLLHVTLPYVYVVLRRLVRGGTWRPDAVKLRQSILANLLILFFAAASWESFHVHTQFRDVARDHPVPAAIAVTLLVALLAASLRLRAWLGRVLEVLGRLLIRPGLFENFERRRFVASKVDVERLRRSPMRVLLTATDLEAGTARFFSNGPPEALAGDPGADARFVAEEVSAAGDLMSAVMASSALPIAYEPMPMGGHTFGDGGIVANQPIRPAVRLGADVVFLVMVDAPGARHPRLDTFVDVGRRALDILIQQNMLADMATLDRFNALCLEAARQAGARPEELEVDTGHHRYRYVRPFTIRPREELGTGILDFGDPRTVEVIARGYTDAGEQLRDALVYVDGARAPRPRRILRMTVDLGA